MKIEKELEDAIYFTLKIILLHGPRLLCSLTHPPPPELFSRNAQSNSGVFPQHLFLLYDGATFYDKY